MTEKGGKGLRRLELAAFALLSVYTATLIYTAVVLFFFMWFIDAFAAKRAFLRLSLEDLFKLWAIVFFFLWALQICRDRIDDLKRASGSWTAGAA